MLLGWGAFAFECGADDRPDLVETTPIWMATPKIGHNGPRWAAIHQKQVGKHELVCCAISAGIVPQWRA